MLGVRRFPGFGHAVGISINRRDQAIGLKLSSDRPDFLVGPQQKSNQALRGNIPRAALSRLSKEFVLSLREGPGSHA